MTDQSEIEPPHALSATELLAKEVETVVAELSADLHRALLIDSTLKARDDGIYEKLVLETLGPAVKRLRTLQRDVVVGALARRGLTQREAASLTGVAVSTLLRWKKRSR